MPGVGNKYYRVNTFPKNQRIRFLRYEGSRVDKDGIPTEYWTDVGSRWAYVEHRNGRYVWKNGGYSDKVTDVFRINYDFGFKPTTNMVVVYNDDLYSIESIDNVREANDEIELRVIRYEASPKEMKPEACYENIPIH